MAEVEKIKSEADFITLRKKLQDLSLEEESPFDERKNQIYFKKLRNYFLYGDQTDERSLLNTVSVFLEPYLKIENFSLEFPALYNQVKDDIFSMHGLISALFQDIEHKLVETRIQDVSPILEQVHENNSGNNLKLAYADCINNITEDLLVHLKEKNTAALLKGRGEKLRKQLLTPNTTLIGYSALTGIRILNLQLKKRNERNQVFLDTLKKSISGLEDILRLQEGNSDHTPIHLDFADELVSFDKIDAIAPQFVNSGMPENKLNRLRSCLQTLTEAYGSYSESCCSIFVSQKLIKEFNLKKELDQAYRIVASKNPSKGAYEYYQSEILKFIEVIAAIRLTKLLVDQQYDEDLHVPYFERFSYSNLGEEDLKSFRTLLVIEEGPQIMQSPNDFIRSLADNTTIKLLAFNRLDEISLLADQADRNTTFLELASLALFHRNAYIFQGGMDTPVLLNNAFKIGLETPGPALWNILFSKPNPDEKKLDYLAVKMAIESRYFPRLVYNPYAGKGLNDHLDLSMNPSSEKPFPVFSRSVNYLSKEEIYPFPLTMADFKALHPENLNSLEIIPEQYHSEDVISLADYLNGSPNLQTGKIPFIWTVDDENKLRKAVIPMSWVHFCRSRLDYWQFLQELGGVNRDRIDLSIKEARSAWEAEKKAEIEDLETRLQIEFDRSRAADLGIAIERMLNNLLDNDVDIQTTVNQISTTLPINKEDQGEGSVPLSENQNEELTSSVIPDVWVESEECTSCNDCIEALPTVFKYNDDKQAYVHNAQGGTYAKIVATAEKCPAACIHPGLPFNTDEPGLEKLIKRAEKYN